MKVLKSQTLVSNIKVLRAYYILIFEINGSEKCATTLKIKY